MVTPQRPIEHAAPVIQDRRRAAVRLAFLALIGVTSLAARDHEPTRDYASQKIGDWIVSASKDGKGCFVTRTYDRPGDTTVLLGVDIDGTNRLSVLNANWSIKPKDRLKLNFSLSNSSYPAHFAVGMVSEGKQGFVTSFGEKFPSYFGSSRALHISRGDVPVERLDLDGSSAAVAELKNCVADQRAKPAAARDDGQRPDHIPTDPFAPASKRKSKR